MALPIGSGSRRSWKPGRAGRVLYCRSMLKILLEKSRYLVVIAVLACLAASLAAFGWGAFKAWDAVTSSSRAAARTRSARSSSSS